jgi:endonuclease-3
MAASKTLKSTDRQSILKDLTVELKKLYKGEPPKNSRNVMETLLLGICLEDCPYEIAESALQTLLDSFLDLNEIRVSSITELERALGKIPGGSDWKALRIRETLQDVFEKQYSFDLEALKRKTLEAASRELEAIPVLTAFARTFALQCCLGAHLAPIDQSTYKAIRWLGLTAPNATLEATADEIRAATKKSDAPLLCYLLKNLALDSRFKKAFERPPGDVDPHEAVKRLKALIKNGPLPPTKEESSAAKVQAKPKAPAVPPTKKKDGNKAEQPESKKVTVKKPAAKPAATKKTAPKSKAASKAAPKKVTKKKPTKQPTNRSGKR